MAVHISDNEYKSLQLVHKPGFSTHPVFAPSSKILLDLSASVRLSTPASLASPRSFFPEIHESGSQELGLYTGNSSQNLSGKIPSYDSSLTRLGHLGENTLGGVTSGLCAVLLAHVRIFCLSL